MIRKLIARQSSTRIGRLWATYWFCLFVIMHLPKPDRIDININNLDKIAHFILYALLALFCALHRARRNQPATLRWSASWLLIFSLYAGADELLQPFVNRTASVADWLTDIAAVTVVLAIAHRRSRAHRAAHPQPES